MRRTSISRAATLTAALSGLLCVHSAQAQASDPYLGQLMAVAFQFCPNGWAEANGALMSISQNSALFALLGTAYGGNGIQSFGLPDLRGRVPVGVGAGPGLSSVVQGQQWGWETTTLNTSNLPAHTHSQTMTATTSAATHSSPSSTRLPAQAQNAGVYAESGGPTVAMASGQTGAAGGNQPISVRDPSLGVRWCIATQGVFPSRP